MSIDQKAPNEFVAGLAERFDEALKNKGLFKNEGETQIQFHTRIAKRYDVSYKTIEYIRKGERSPSLSQSIAIADDLNVSYDWLMTGRGWMQQQDVYSKECISLVQSICQLPQHNQESIKDLVCSIQNVT